MKAIYKDIKEKYYKIGLTIPLFLLSFTLSTAVYSQNIPVRFDRLSTKDGLSQNNRFIRYYVDIPEDIDNQLKYYGTIEISGLDESITYELEIIVSDRTPLLAFLDFELFELPFTATPTGAIIGGEAQFEGRPFTVGHLLIFLGVILLIWGAITIIRKNYK